MFPRDVPWAGTRVPVGRRPWSAVATRRGTRTPTCQPTRRAGPGGACSSQARRWCRDSASAAASPSDERACVPLGEARSLLVQTRHATGGPGTPVRDESGRARSSGSVELGPPGMASRSVRSRPRHLHGTRRHHHHPRPFRPPHAGLSRTVTTASYLGCLPPTDLLESQRSNLDVTPPKPSVDTACPRRSRTRSSRRPSV